MSELRSFAAGLKTILREDSRFHADAYLFVMAALSRALAGLKTPRHLTGAELLGGIRHEAVRQYGPMARTVFEYWGIKNSLDFGEIVFKMVQVGILTKTDSDRLDDFADKDFFDNLFDSVSAYQLERSDKKVILTKK